MLTYFSHLFLFYFSSITQICVCWGCKVGTGDAQCGGNFVVILLFLGLYICFTHKQHVMELISMEKDLISMEIKLKTLAMMEVKQKPFDMDEFAKKAILPCEPDTHQGKTRIGRDGFNKNLVTTVDELKGERIMQDTKALVLACASGVGKTFATLTARQGFQQQQMELRGKAGLDTLYEPVVAYIGFNCASPLSGAEISFLGDKSIDGQRCVNVLVLSRLFAWLNGYKQLQSEKQQPSPTVLDIPDSDVQMQFELGELMTEGDLKGVLVNDMTTRIKEMLEEFGKQTPGLVLIVVVDEGQMLDENREDGARFALRCLRNLQMQMMAAKEAVRVLPVCTGIDPQTHLPHATEGQNIPLMTYDEVLLSVEEFDRLFLTIYDKAQRDRGREDEKTEYEMSDVNLFAALTWPRVRPVMWMRKQGFKSSVAVSRLMWAPNTTDWDVRRILQAAADGDYLAADVKVPTNMVRMIDAKERQCPVIDYTVLDDVGSRLGSWGFSKWIPDQVHLKDLSTQDCWTFEGNALRTLALFLLFFYHNRETTHPLPAGKKTSLLRNWVPESVNKVDIIELKNNRRQSHPFNVQDWRDKSKELGEGCDPASKKDAKLSTEFDTALKASTLMKVGGAVLLHCGASAPMDFILVTLEEGKTLQVRYADAKHRTDPEMAKLSTKTMLKKAEDLHNKLRKLLDGRFTVPEWKASNFLLITNSQVKDVRVMSPVTTTWEPMTRVLYRSVPAIPTSSVLASRPVYPVLSQLPEMTRNTWSTPPPQTGARLTRTVPVLWFVRRLKFM